MMKSAVLLWFLQIRNCLVDIFLNIRCRSQQINFSSLLENRFKDVRHDYNQGRTNKLNCIYIAVAYVIVLTMCLPLYALSRWPDAVYEVRSFECIVEHLKFIKVLTDEETAEIQIQTPDKEKNRKLMEILLNGGEDHYDKFIEALNAFKEYKHLAKQIKNTGVTPDDKKFFQNA